MAADGITLELETKRFQRWTGDLVRTMEKEQASRVLRAIALELLRRVMLRTPVDQGRARGGWGPGLEKLGGQVHGGMAAGRAKGHSEGSYTEQFRSAKPFVLIVNAVPYIVPLEFGWSRQAPHGMLRMEMLEIRLGNRLAKELREKLQDGIRKVNMKHLAGRGVRLGK